MTINNGTSSIKIVDSYLVPKQDMTNVLKQARRAFPEHPIWARRISSLVNEWCVHNALYRLHIARARTKDVDFEVPCKMELFYILLGPLAKLIINSLNPMENYNLYFEKYMAGIAGAAVGAFFDNLLTLFLAVLFFEALDFITGCWKSAVVAHRNNERFAFESIKAWRTVYKVVFIVVGTVAFEWLDGIFASGVRMGFANYFVGGVCGIETWSFLENAAVISDWAPFRWLSKYMKVKVEDKIGAKFETNDNG